MNACRRTRYAIDTTTNAARAVRAGSSASAALFPASANRSDDEEEPRDRLFLRGEREDVEGDRGGEAKAAPAPLGEQAR